LSELVQCFAHAGFCLVAEVFEGGLEQRGDVAGEAFKGEVGGVGKLGSDPTGWKVMVSTAMTVLFCPRRRMSWRSTNSSTT
jgi:hypothetical protein